SVTGMAPKSVLVMIDGEFATDLRPLRTRIESILVATIAFDPETDALHLKQFPFARGVGTSLTSQQISELLGLGLLAALLLVAAVAPRRERRTTHHTPDRLVPSADHRPQARLTAAQPAAIPERQDAAALAETNPNETAQVVRSWMSYAED
ncbi:MAG: hypothetical protein AAFW60_00665, partial [Pseudomonadota bacterium]